MPHRTVAHLLEMFLGQTATQIREDMGYVMISFASGDGVTISNDCTLRNCEGDGSPGALQSLEITKERIVFQFGGGCSVTIDMTAPAWHGPEALEWFRASDDQIWVWNTMD